MSDTKALAKKTQPPIEEQAALVNAYYSVAFDKDANRDVAAQQLAQLIAKAAEGQIDAETNKDSPWFVEAADDAEARERKAMVREGEITKRALQISQARVWADEQAQIYIVKHFQKRRLDLFPADGTWREMEEVIRELLPPSRSGAVFQVVKFLDDAEAAIDGTEITTKDVVDLVDDKGAYVVGRLGTAIRQEVPDNATDEERAEIVEQLFDDAKSLSKSQFQRKHGGKKAIEPLLFRSFKDADGEWFMIQAQNSRQAGALRSRMSGMITYDPGISFAGVRASDLYSVWHSLVYADVCDTAPEFFDRITNDIRAMMHQAVLSDGVAFAVYQVLLHAEAWRSLDDVNEVLTMYDRTVISEAIGRLARYGVIQEMTDSGERLYAAEMPDTNEVSEDE
jgi:hypothetical protein